MRPAKPDAAAQSDMFRETLEAILDPRHELPEPGRRIDRAKLDAACGETYLDQVGRPGLPTRPMAGPHILKHVKGLSDEAVCAARVENPYFQAFCGERFFQHRLPLDRSSSAVNFMLLGVTVSPRVGSRPQRDRARRRGLPERSSRCAAKYLGASVQAGACCDRRRRGWR